MKFSRLNVGAAIGVLGLAISFGWGEPTAAEDSADEQAVQWLDRLEQRGEEIETLTGKVDYEREDELLGGTDVRLGKVWYAAGNGEDGARFAIHFDQIVTDDGAVRPYDVAYIFDGEWLAERQGDRKLFQKRQVVPPGEQFDPLQIDGPFPLPIGQKRDEVLERFDVELIEPEPDSEREHLVHLRLTPREDVPAAYGEAEFDVVDMWFDRETLLPARVETRERHNRTAVILEDQTVNELDEEDLAERFDTDPPPEGSGWRVEVSPYRD